MIRGSWGGGGGGFCKVAEASYDAEAAVVEDGGGERGGGGVVHAGWEDGVLDGEEGCWGGCEGGGGRGHCWEGGGGYGVEGVGELRWDTGEVLFVVCG